MRRKTIRFRLTVWFSLFLMIVILAAFALYALVSVSVLRKTIRSYLIGAVESNIDKMVFVQDEARAGIDLLASVFISYGDGWLQIDNDFLKSMNDVDSSLYSDDGTFLYGTNPIVRQMEGEPFSEARIYRKRANGESYYIYDRKLTGKGLKGLWIRGVVPLRQEKQEMADILRLSLILLPVVMIFSIVGSYLIVGRLLAPLRQIEQSALAISSGNDLRGRIAIGDGEDEICHMAQAFNGMLDRLEESFAAEKRFTSDVSHELRTPMSVIMAQTELVLEKERNPQQYRKALFVIERQGRRMHKLIEDMLVYSRLDRGTDHYPLEDIDFSRLLETVCRDMQLLENKNITLEYKIAPAVTIWGNELLLSRMVQNLIDNAYKYGRKDGHIYVSLCLTGQALGSQTAEDTGTGSAHGLASSEELLLTVADDGIGISGEDAGKVFERFFRGDTSRSREGGETAGNGLGLSMVEQIARVHSAEVSVESRPGEGSTFFVRFSNEALIFE